MREVAFHRFDARSGGICPHGKWGNPRAPTGHSFGSLGLLSTLKSARLTFEIAGEAAGRTIEGSASRKLRLHAAKSADRGLGRLNEYLGRTFLTRIPHLERHRAKVQQAVRVERVTLNNSGQANLGNVSDRRGDDV